jgi:hypothetical protein
MRQPKVDDHVRLTRGIPDLWLHQGESGIVCSTWLDPTVAFEVEFHTTDPDDVIRALVLGEQLELEEESLFEKLAVHHPGPTRLTASGSAVGGQNTADRHTTPSASASARRSIRPQPLGEEIAMVYNMF